MIIDSKSFSMSIAVLNCNACAYLVLTFISPHLGQELAAKRQAKCELA